MAITFIPQNRRQQYLLSLLGAIVLLGFGIWGYQFVRKEPFSLFQSQLPLPRQVQIDFSVFEKPVFLELGEARPPILPSDQVGKPNPFAP